MNTEQMNRDIAKWIGVDVDFDDNVYRDSRSPLRQYIDNKPKTEPLLFDTSWDWLMPVWQKLRGELVLFRKDVLITAQKRLLSTIEDAILDTDLPRAHKLIYEAIALIKK